VRNARSGFIIPLVLFLAFSLAALAVLSASIRAYDRESRRADRNFVSMTASAYVTEKVRQSGGADCISTGKIGSRPALIIDDENGKYSTYIYSRGGSLMELYTKKSSDADPADGTKILEAGDFSARWAEKGLLAISYRDTNGKEDTSFVNVLSGENS
jgi:hypothetical protein